MLKILHVTNRRSQIAPDGPFANALRELGELVLLDQAKELSDDEVLAQMLSDLISRCALITMMYQSAQDARNSNAEHAAIVEAIRERDTERALSLMNTHLDHVEASLAFPASPKNKQKQAA